MRWFTVEVRPAWRVLIAAPHDADASRATTRSSCREALAPDAFRVKGEAAFECEVISTDAAGAASRSTTTRPCACVDPRPLDAGGVAKAALLCGGRRRTGHCSWAAMPRRSTRSTSRSRKNCCPASWCGSGAATRQLCARGLPASGAGQVSRAGSRLGAVAGVSALAIGRRWPRGAGVVSALFRRSAGARRAAGRQGARADDDHADLRSDQPPRSAGTCCRPATSRGRS